MKASLVGASTIKLSLLPVFFSVFTKLPFVKKSTSVLKSLLPTATSTISFGFGKVVVVVAVVTVVGGEIE